MKQRAHYRIIEGIDGRAERLRPRLPAGCLLIEDVGPWNCHPTVTNDAENVVAELRPFLPDGRRLFYYDSEGRLDELLVFDGQFGGFKAGPR